MNPASNHLGRNTESNRTCRNKQRNNRLQRKKTFIKIANIFLKIYFVAKQLSKVSRYIMITETIGVNNELKLLCKGTFWKQIAFSCSPIFFGNKVNLIFKFSWISLCF